MLEGVSFAVKLNGLVLLLFLGIVLGLSWLIRRYIPILSTLFIPSSVIARFLKLLMGPQTLGKLTNSPGLIPGEAIAVAWSVLGVLYLVPRIYREPWFEHGLADFGQAQGSVAPGFIFANMADPLQKTNAATAYGYKQLTYEPILGGGVVIALSVPLIMSWGSLVFGVIAAI